MYSLNVTRKNRVFKDILKIAIPTSIEFFLFNIISFTDNIMVSYLGDYQIAGVSLANKLFELLGIISFAVMGASGVLSTRQYAKGDMRAFKSTFYISILIMLFFSLLFIIISFTFPTLFLGLLSDDPNAIYYGIQYLDVAVFSFLFAVVKGIIANSLKTLKITNIQVITAGISVVINIILNYVFMFVLNMGVIGAALATTIVRVIEIIFYLSYTILNQKSYFYLRKEDLKINKSIFNQMIKLFIPIFLNEFIWALGFLALTAIFARVDTTKYAAYSVTFSIYFMCFNVINAFCLSVNIVMGNEMHKPKDEIMSVAVYLSRIGVVLALITALMMCSLSFFTPYMFYKLEYANLTGLMLRYYAITVFFTSLAFQYLFGFFRAGASPNFGAIMEGSVTLLYTIPIAYVLANYTNLPFELVVFIPTLEDVIKLSISLPYFYSKKWIKTIKTN